MYEATCHIVTISCSESVMTVYNCYSYTTEESTEDDKDNRHKRRV